MLVTSYFNNFSHRLLKQPVTNNRLFVLKINSKLSFLVYSFPYTSMSVEAVTERVWANAKPLSTQIDTENETQFLQRLRPTEKRTEKKKKYKGPCRR
jgi:hypothetical protein